MYDVAFIDCFCYLPELLPMLLIRESSLFSLLLNFPLDSLDNFFVAYVSNEELRELRNIQTVYVYYTCLVENISVLVLAADTIRIVVR